MEVLRGARIRSIADWSWERNACALRLGDRDVTGPLPPLASPCAVYTVRLDLGGVVADWVHEPPRWEPPSRGLLDGAAEPVLAAARKALSLSPSAPRERILHAAGMCDLQIVPDMGGLCGALDGLALAPAKRQLLFDNYISFGRHEARCFKRPRQAVPLPTDAHPLAAQRGDVSRAADPAVRQLAVAAAAWRVARLARPTGGVTRAAVARDYGERVAHVLETETDAFHAPPAAALACDPLPMPVVLTVPGKRTNVMLTHAPGDGDTDTIHWFAPNRANAIRHPNAFLRDGRVGAYAVHERAGAVYVVSAQGDAVTSADGRELTRGGVEYTAHPCVLEGGDSLFTPGSLRRVGFYCCRDDGRTWSDGLVRRVLRLMAPEGTACTNSVSSAFIARACAPR